MMFRAKETAMINFFCSRFRATMAKSLRSKWKRKMKAVKRVRYGEKVGQFLDNVQSCYSQLKVLTHISLGKSCVEQNH